MSLIVQKYGGSVLSDFSDLAHIGKNIKDTLKRQVSVVAVVSALKKETDKLISYAKALCSDPDPRELDMLISTGEQKSGALLSLYLQSIHIPAISFTGHQIGMITDSEHGNASIFKINSEKILGELHFGRVVIVAGFQGVNALEEITTLGRGGSDLTAVALGAALKAEFVEFYKDTEGILNVNPSLKKGKRIKKIDYTSLLELARGDVKIVSAKAAELAAKYSVPLIIKSLDSSERTVVVNEDFSFAGEKMLALSVKDDEYQIIVKDISDESIVKLLSADPNINFLDKLSGEGKSRDRLLFTVNPSHLKSIERTLDRQGFAYSQKGPFKRILVVGWGYGKYEEFYRKIVGMIGKKGIKVHDMHFSGYSVSMLLDPPALEPFADHIARENYD